MFYDQPNITRTELGSVTVLAKIQPSSTPEPWRGLPKVKFPSRQWFSKVDIVS